MHNKEAVQIYQPLHRSTESASSYLGIATEVFARNPHLKEQCQILLLLASTILVVTGPAILVCAASKSFATLGVVLMLYLVGGTTGAAIFSFRADGFKSHILPIR